MQDPPKETKPPEPPETQMGYGNRNFEQKESKSKWGPPTGANSGGSGPKSLMDMNFNNNSYRDDRPRGPPPSNQGGAPWNQNRPHGPRQGGGPPRGNAPPWHQNGPPARGIYLLIKSVSFLLF